MTTNLSLGTIKSVDHEALSATLITTDGRELSFTDAEWDGIGRPVPGAQVLYRLNGDKIDLVGLRDSTIRLIFRRIFTRVGWFFALLFSFSGRISRLRFNVVVFGVWLPLLSLLSLYVQARYHADIELASKQLALPESARVLPPGLKTVGLLIVPMLLLCWISLTAAAIRRIRDFELNALWLLAPFVAAFLTSLLHSTLGDALGTFALSGLAAGLIFWPSRAADATKDKKNADGSVSAPAKSRLRQRIQ